MDTLRGSFGTVGYIIRARSARKSMSSHGSRTGRSRRGADVPGTLYGQDGLGSQLPGVGKFTRHQLYDPPVPSMSRDSTSETLSVVSNITDGTLKAPDSANTTRSPRTPTIKFDDHVAAHYYPQPGAKGGPRHEHLQAATREGQHILRDGSLPNLPPRTPESARSSTVVADDLTPRADRTTHDQLNPSFFPPQSSKYRDPFEGPGSNFVGSSRFPSIDEVDDDELSPVSPSKRKSEKKGRSHNKHYPRSGTVEDQEESISLVDRGGIRAAQGHNYTSSSESDTNPEETSIRLVSSKTRI